MSPSIPFSLSRCLLRCLSCLSFSFLICSSALWRKCDTCLYQHSGLQKSWYELTLPCLPRCRNSSWPCHGNFSWGSVSWILDDLTLAPPPPPRCSWWCPSGLWTFLHHYLLHVRSSRFYNFEVWRMAIPSWNGGYGETESYEATVHILLLWLSWREPQESNQRKGQSQEREKWCTSTQTIIKSIHENWTDVRWLRTNKLKVHTRADNRVAALTWHRQITLQVSPPRPQWKELVWSLQR